MKQITREWLKAADDDIAAMERMLGDSRITNVVAFHAQQCIEKSFKAVIEEFEIGLIKTHNIESLYSKIQHWVEDVNEQIIAELDTLYIEARYPGEMGLMPEGKPPLEDARKYFQEAVKI